MTNKYLALVTEEAPPSDMKKVIFFSQNKGQLRAAVTRPCRLSTPLCHTYSEPPGHELSPGGTQNIPYIFKNLSKSQLSDPFFWIFLGVKKANTEKRNLFITMNASS